MALLASLGNAFHLFVDRCVIILLTTVAANPGRHMFDVDRFPFVTKPGQHLALFQVAFTYFTAFVLHWYHPIDPLLVMPKVTIACNFSAIVVSWA
jgi:hypothetical protein